MNLGDTVAEALSTVGITPERVEQWVGAPCGCRERQDKLNSLGAWAARVAQGKLLLAREYIERILTTE